MTKLFPPKCNQCDSTTINGVYCHEHGCPNINKIYDFEEEMWIEEEEEMEEDYFEEPEEDIEDIIARKEKESKLGCGCIFDNHRGIYMGEAIIQLAESYGFTLQVPEDRTNEGEFHWEAVYDAIDYLNENVAEEGFMFDYGIGASDFMYMPEEWWSEE